MVKRCCCDFSSCIAVGTINKQKTFLHIRMHACLWRKHTSDGIDCRTYRLLRSIRIGTSSEAMRFFCGLTSFFRDLTICNRSSLRTLTSSFSLSLQLPSSMRDWSSLVRSNAYSISWITESMMSEFSIVRKLSRFRIWHISLSLPLSLSLYKYIYI